jgi:hypothetical protein
MQLIECSDCHKQISDEAYSCPNCGKPMRGHQGWAKPLVLFGLALLCVVIPLFGMAFLCISRTLWQNLRTSVKGAGEDLLRRF